MAIRDIDHITIATDKLAEMRAFFCDVLELKEGWRPGIAFAGAWLYLGDRAVVHLMETKEPRRPSRESALDHFAFAIDDYDGAAQRLDAAKIPYRVNQLGDGSIRQIFIGDFGGVNIELNYRAPG